MNIDEIVANFDRDGYVLLPQAIGPEELAALQEDSAHIIEEGYEGKEPESDYFFDALPDTGEVVFHRVQYVFPKAKNNSFIKLLAHPLVLQVVRRLLGMTSSVRRRRLFSRCRETARRSRSIATVIPASRM